MLNMFEDRHGKVNGFIFHDSSKTKLVNSLYKCKDAGEVNVRKKICEIVGKDRYMQ